MLNRYRFDSSRNEPKIQKRASFQNFREINYLLNLLAKTKYPIKVRHVTNNCDRRSSTYWTQPHGQNENFTPEFICRQMKRLVLRFPYK